MTLSLKSRVELHNKQTLPIMGLGTYLLKGKILKKALNHALSVGYRLIDTATLYQNEKEIGDVIQKSEISRDEIFITSKVWNSDQGYESTITAFKKSLERLQTDYIDLYLIHWPIPQYLKETWRALEYLYQEGLCRSIGVSNFYRNHLEKLSMEGDIIPMVNQIEFNPFLNVADVLNYCNENQIVVEAYAPLSHGYKLQNEKLLKVAEAYQKSPAQILLRWCLQTHVIPIPKSQNLHRITENSEIFDFNLTSETFYEMNAWNENFHSDWDPSDV